MVLAPCFISTLCLASQNSNELKRRLFEFQADFFSKQPHVLNKRASCDDGKGNYGINSFNFLGKLSWIKKFSCKQKSSTKSCAFQPLLCSRSMWSAMSTTTSTPITTTRTTTTSMRFRKMPTMLQRTLTLAIPLGWPFCRFRGKDPYNYGNQSC